MQFSITAAVAVFAALAMAAPAPETPSSGACTPATYACLDDGAGWQVCNTGGVWVFAGDCPPKTSCHFNVQNQSPYCI
ncbi:hypothetical protein F5X68DRAFT_233711 [Plectosphaerella plurivora]|uniref:Uncharacterized protein n=1 Tax=Plectosphaerella plurivora TaxID=936078 RepID=A0A9P9A6X6_9PEZI|nr:hypothetical protein F5X68DRAFT_233711 [Plectosphaerella plurivora]